jgi:hypothetical protein
MSEADFKKALDYVTHGPKGEARVKPGKTFSRDFCHCSDAQRQAEAADVRSVQANHSGRVQGGRSERSAVCCEVRA